MKPILLYHFKSQAIIEALRIHIIDLNNICSNYYFLVGAVDAVLFKMLKDFMKTSQIISSIMSRTATNAYFATQAHKHIGISKTDATIPNYEAVIIGAIEKAKLSVEKINFLVHGTPVIINCLTERKGAKIGLITTTGFRDILETGRGNRPDFFNLNYVKPVPSWSDISYGNERTSKPQRRGALSTRPLKICSQSSPTSTKTTSEASQSVS